MTTAIGLVGVADGVVLQQLEAEDERAVLFVRVLREGGLWSGVITSTTPGCALAASTSNRRDPAAGDAG